MMAVKFIIGLLLVFLLVTFAVKNQQEVLVSYYMGYEFNVKLWLAILIAFVGGFVLSAIGVGFSLVREKSKCWSLNRKVVKLEGEIGQLKQKPIPDEPSVYPSTSDASAQVAHIPKALPASSSVKSLPEPVAEKVE